MGKLQAILMVGALLATPFDQEERAWREKRLNRLKSEDGWLTLVALHWLNEGENQIDPFGLLTLQKGVVRHQGKELKNDLTEKPDILKSGDLQAYVIKRGEKFGVRVKNPKNPIRTEFKGTEYFEPKSDYKIVADFVSYPEPKDRTIPTILKTNEVMKALGIVKFKLNGKEFSLEPVLETPNDKQLFYIFRDDTSGKETYPAGRYMYSELPKDGKVTINFNRAYNPPCAFTPYATCPLPPPQNWLSVRIEAGEKTFGKH